ncbi:hypothetical protein BCR36DRAFT_329040 [Piromyces finnis]|uniref:CBM10 domain-containing protein n=1 Tax=Piromyces finnis TaxID=1754191 RepID=A0A1Y1V7E4_9FUNG|nr:hypothetical protein BCR36DRAFT_329040 [Piromyces finnis]|eukprot:ORX48628.1 hypothetical protein BCR36DRAFT_329040 [Piromyces finnis]
MKFTDLASALLFVTLTTAHTNFIKDGNRAKLFELLDNEVPDFRITIPDEEFVQLKNEVGYLSALKKRQWGDGNWGDGNFDFGNFDFGNFDFGDFDFGALDFGQEDNYKVKDASMITEINGKKKSFDKVTFSVGGSSSRTYARQAFNLKIRSKGDLYGRKQFRIRSEAREATLLRSKLACDIHNYFGMPSISANYISLYINDEYWGFYLLMDAPKPSWAELEYDDENTTHIYKCKQGGNALTYKSCATACVNENEEAIDNSEWESILTALDNAKSAEDIEDIFDVDQFLYEMAYEYLSGSWDHFLSSGHNFIMYKMPEAYGGKWTMILYDFDADFGQDVCALEFMGSVKDDKDYPSWSWKDWNNKPRHIVDILINNDRTRFTKVMKKMIDEVFNPEVLFERIDELKKFIKPYILKDKTPVNGRMPGVLNEKIADDYTMAHWEANSEFTNIGVSSSSSGYGLKYWILNRYRKACSEFNLDCDEKYLDLNYYYDIDRSVEGPINTEFNMFNFGQQQQPKPETPKTTQSQPPKPTATSTTVTPTSTQVSNDCVALYLGYPCCSPDNTYVVYQDESGDWGVENNEWCGITKVNLPSSTCWSEKLGYPCCKKNFFVVYTDEDGDWSVENNEWCGINN